MTDASGTSISSATISLTPASSSLAAGDSQQFVATVANASNSAVTWTLALAPIAPQAAGSIQAASSSAGTISPTGLYTAPANPPNQMNVQLTATSIVDSHVSASTNISVTPSLSMTVSPAVANVTAGAAQLFSASLSSLTLQPVQWLVNGVAGGGRSMGTITANGIYIAPSVNPGTSITIQAVSLTFSNVTGSATVTVVNPPQLPLTGITYSKLLNSWNDTQLPWVEDLSGLQWDVSSRTWTPVSDWTAPVSTLAPMIFNLYQALDPLTEMAIAKQDVSLMEELALFHVALLNRRTMTIGALVQNAPPGAYINMTGPSTDRTFGYQTMYTATQVEVAECPLCNLRYLLSAARLLRAIAQLPPTQRTTPLTSFVSSFSGFLVNEQLIRMYSGSTFSWQWNNPNIPLQLVSAWTFLAKTGYEPPHPIKYQAAMTDPELWILADTAEALGADAAAPELNILDNNSRPQLLEAVAAGTALLQMRSSHITAPDGADTLSTLAGDTDDDPDNAYDAYEGPETPTTPDEKYGLMTDSMHSSTLPSVFQSLYQNRDITGESFPALTDIVGLANSYVHLAFNGNTQLPDFNNFLDGWNGWFRVGDPSIPGGYPPHQYCNGQLDPDNCMTAGTVQGWGHLAVYNPDLAALEQNLISLANDDSDAASAFKAQHYWYNGPYTANARDYPAMMIYIGGDVAGMVN